MATSRSRSSISPFRSRRTPPPPPTAATKGPARPSIPSSIPGSAAGSKPSPSPPTERPKSKENVTVTVRFRPLSAREINKGDEVAWYADGDCTVQSERNASIAYCFDRVFGPATTTRHVYDVAAQHVVSGAMEGINGTVFAYGVTSSGKTHTMHGEQKSPGIIPLAIKDVFSIIQETPGREFLLRVSYLEIYNEVINDLLDPTGQNLRIREDSQGTFVEGIKEEVVLSPAHAFSLIASGEEHRHVGSNNFNLLSSRSHTIFTLTIESSPSGENKGEEDVTLSQLNLIDLAGSESSKTETTGLRRKEGSYINKSLLTLGTVISKLTDSKATHIPYRDSKLTRILQSSLSGHGRISLICTVTPASSASEETHNTLKFAHRSKHVEIKASQNKIMDEKSLIKKYQKEILCLKEELQQLKRGMMEKPYLISGQEDLVNLKLQLEAGQVKLQSRLEEEEQAKAALMGRIQRLTKLILVSTKNSIPSNVSQRAGHRRRHSFGEDELAYLPDRKREYIADDDALSLDSEFSSEGKCDSAMLEESIKFDKKNRRGGMLGWLKLRRPENLLAVSTSADDSSASGSPSCSQPSNQKFSVGDGNCGRRKSISKRTDDPAIVDSFPERTQAGDLFSATVRGRKPPPTGTTITDQMDLLCEQLKMLAGEVALSTSSLKRLSEQAARNPEDLQIVDQMQRLKDEINEKKFQMYVLEKRMVGSFETSPHAANSFEMSQAVSKLAAQLNEKTFELEIMSADNRILQEQLQLKMSEISELQESVLMRRQQVDSLLDGAGSREQYTESEGIRKGLSDETCFDGTTTKSNVSFSGTLSNNDSSGGNSDESLKERFLVQAAEIENLRRENVRFQEEKDGLEIQSQKLSEEASYAKELASAAAVELRNLAEEVTKLSYQNAKLTADLAAARDVSSGKNSQRNSQTNGRHDRTCNRHSDYNSRISEDVSLIDELQKELFSQRQRESSLEASLVEKDRTLADLQKRLDEAKTHEQELEHELANMWILVAQLKSGKTSEQALFQEENALQPCSKMRNGFSSSKHYAGTKSERFYLDKNNNYMHELDEIKVAFENERRRCYELEDVISKLKSENLRGLDATTLEELQKFHVEALSKICQEKLASRAL